ncbi:hypothetical protein BDDG_08681 [Blastomyces dermatitidis ATCC 18188]|uniref:DUF2293 domain-containing protein n=1 Tax=Ajellomyces dermatitidis (strain ATCC 18188 / CBS 674.68) TaxID=653446 RepID=F2TR73_AJEDA|nr:hypothetical protein BDDG_08681 [Blastomyces dermatitidis ATCC 18188]
MASETTRGKRKRPSSRPQRRNPGNSTAASKLARKKQRVSNSDLAGGGTGTRLPRELRRALEKQNAAKEKLGDSSLEAIRTESEGPPPDYVFVPKGDVYITRNCRSLSHEAKQTVYTVYNPKTQRTLGLYIPSQIHDTVTKAAANTLPARARAVAQKDARDTSKARALLRAQFPAMPAETLETVLGHAFLKGSRRVGRSGKVASEEVKVGLAVDAHIRHVHTEYERLLRDGVQREEARKRVWGAVRRVRELWEGKREVEVEAASKSGAMKKPRARARARAGGRVG